MILPTSNNGATPEKIHELQQQKHTCCICGREFSGIGWDPRPVHAISENGHMFVCCEECYNTKVSPIADAQRQKHIDDFINNMP